MLPSRYAAEAYRKRDQFGRHHPENSLMLTCPDCGRKGKYDVGAMVVNPTGPAPFESIQFTGYFRCKHCNAAGDWDIPPFARLEILVSSAMLAAGMKPTDDRVIFGTAPLYDGHEARFATGSEEHLLRKLRASPENIWLWDRLGNLYNRSGRPDLAFVVFEEAVRRDPAQFESHFSLGMLLYGLGHQEEAGHHLRMALASARGYERLDSLELREFVAHALRQLFWLSHLTEGRVPVAPTRKEYGAAQFTPLFGSDVPPMVQTHMDSDDLSTFYSLAEGFVGQERIAATKRAKELTHARTETAASMGTPVRVGRKIGRNEPCPCGSGLKYKRCCGRET